MDPEDSLDDYDPYQQLFQSDLWDLVVQDEDLDEWMLESFEEDLESDDREEDEEDEDDDQNRKPLTETNPFVNRISGQLNRPRSAGTIALGCSIFWFLADCSKMGFQKWIEKMFP